MENEHEIDQFLAIMKADMMTEVSKGGYANVKVTEIAEKVVMTTKYGVENVQIQNSRTTRMYTIEVFI